MGVGRKAEKELPGQKIYSIQDSPTGEYTAQLRTTLKGKLYKAFFTYMREEELRESDAVRSLIVAGLKSKGITWR
jgi:hypothetical protein